MTSYTKSGFIGMCMAEKLRLSNNVCVVCMAKAHLRSGIEIPELGVVDRCAYMKASVSRFVVFAENT